MPKVMLSPSDQYANTYAYGDTNEGVVCQRICDLVKDILQEEYFGFEVEVEADMYKAVERTNAWRPDLHLAVHTNASPNHTARGCRVFYHSASELGPVYAKAICSSIRYAYDVSYNKNVSHSVKSYDSLYELKATVPIAVYLEIDFHDNVDGAKWILENEHLIAAMIASGIVDCLCKFFLCPHCRERIYFR